MKMMPDTTIRIANAEAVSLGLDVDAPITAVRLLPRFGETRCLPLDSDGLFEFPTFTSPNTVKLEWLETPGAKEAAFTSQAEIVSRHYFTLKQLRNLNPEQDGFDDENEYPDELLNEARQAATDVFEEAAHRSFVHRIGRTKDYGRDSLVNLAHCDVYEVLSEGYVQVSDNQLERDQTAAPMPFPRWIEYLYGSDQMPAEVSRAVLELAAYTLRPSNRPVGATGESTDAGYIHFTTAGRDGATSIPEVNAAIAQFGWGCQFVW